MKEIIWISFHIILSNQQILSIPLKTLEKAIDFKIYIILQKSNLKLFL